MTTSATVRQLQAASLLMAQGLMPSGACAMVGNLSQESGRALPSVFRKTRLDHGSEGLPQWRLDRLDKFEGFVRQKHPDYDVDDLWDQYGRLDYQCEYIALELKRDYPSLDQALRKGGSVSALAARVCWEYERPNKAAANLANRVEQGLIVFRSLPQGASTATKTNIVASLDLAADTHAAQKRTGVVTSAGAVALMGATGVAHVAHSLHWYEWLIGALALFCLIAGVATWLVEQKNEALLRHARANTDMSVVPEKPPTQVAPEAKPTEKPAAVSSEQRRKQRAAQGKAEEQAAIDKAMGRSTKQTEDDAHAAVQAQVDPTLPKAVVPFAQVVKPELNP